MASNETRNATLDRLAIGSDCPACGAWADEPCVTRRSGKPTHPHGARIDRAVSQYLAVTSKHNER